MSKGGSSSPSEVTNTTSNLPEYARPYYESMMGRAAYESVRPYEPYGGQRIAYFNPLEQESIGKTADFARTGTDVGQWTAPYAGDLIGDIMSANPYEGRLNDALDSFSPTNYDPGTLNWNYLEGYMDPYQQAVTDIRKREANRASDIQAEGIEDAATRAGGLGGYREAIMQAERQRNLNQQLDDIQNEGSADAFLRGREAFNQDEARRYQAAQLASQQGLDAANLGISAYGAYGADLSRRAGTIPSLGQAMTTEQSLTLQRLNSLLQAGSSQRGLEQAGMDMAYQDFLRQQAYPREQLSYYSNILQGLPVSPGSSTSVYGSGPSSWQQLLGLGIGGLGVYNALGGQQGAV